MDSINCKSWKRAVSLFLFVIVALTVVLHYALPLRDGDIWFHLQYGKYFIENSTLIPDHTIYSWTPAGNEIIYCTWLSEIFLYCLYSLGGLPLLFVFRYLCICFLFFGAVFYAKQLNLLDHPLTWLLCLLALLMADAGILIKPESISFVLITAVAWNWWHIKSSQSISWKNYYLFPVIMFIWVNSHGGVVFGYVFLASIVVGELLNSIFGGSAIQTENKKHFFLATVLSLLMLLATPYGYRYPLQLLRQFVPTTDNLVYNSHISQYFSPMVLETGKLDLVKLGIIAVALLVMSFFSLVSEKKIDYSFVTTNIMFVSLYTCFYRTTYFWAPVYLFSMLYLFSCKPRIWYQKETTISVILNSALIMVCVLLALYSVHTSLRRPQPYMYTGFGKGDSVPVHETNFIKANYSTLNIGNTYNQGSYLLWELWPENQIMIDSRQFPYRDWSVSFFNFVNNPDAHRDFIKRHDCDVWLVGLHRPQLCLWFIKSSDWDLAYYANNAAVFVKKGVTVSSSYTEKKYTDMLSLQNTYAALAAFRFAISVKDWHMADIVRSRLESFRQISNILDIAENAVGLQKAYQAYFAADYQDTVDSLEGQAMHDYMNNPSMLSFAYTHLANNAWVQQQDETALEYSKKALNAMPTMYSLYNFGIISRYLNQEDPVFQLDGAFNTWQKALEESIKISAYFAVGNHIREMAEAAINGKYLKRPMLLRPPDGEMISCGLINVSKL